VSDQQGRPAWLRPQNNWFVRYIYCNRMRSFLVCALLCLVSGVNALKFRRLIPLRVGHLNLPKLPLSPLFGSGLNDDGGNLVPPTPPSDTNTDGVEDADDEDNDSSGDVVMSPLSALGMGLLDKYNNLLETHMMPTKIVTSGVINGLGDILCQLLDGALKDGKEFDFRRLFIFSLVGGFYFGPMIHYWFEFLNNISPFLPANGAIKAGVQLILDQTVGAVAVIGTFFYFNEVLQHLIPPSTKAPELSLVGSIIKNGNYAFKNTLPETLLANWRYWPIVNFFNFRYVPIQYRLLVSNVASVMWSIVLSKIAMS
jgi:hypothetical protein